MVTETGLVDDDEVINIRAAFAVRWVFCLFVCVNVITIVNYFVVSGRYLVNSFQITYVINISQQGP